MVDFPDVPGKMSEWDTVAAVDGAAETLSYLSKNSKIYVATGASDSTEVDIKAAFKRVDLDKYISGYYCKSNVSQVKGSPEFLLEILKRLNKHPSQLTLVGNSLKKDVEPALAIGINAVWLCKDSSDNQRENIRIITKLKELCLCDNSYVAR